MTIKEQKLQEVLRRDRTGFLIDIHNALLGIGLSFTASKGSETLLYGFRHSGDRCEIAATRVPGPTVFSFPTTFWEPRLQVLSRLRENFQRTELLSVAGPFSSSQYSSEQVRVTAATAPRIITLIERELCAVMKETRRSV
ncbi:MAG: hypothetical protein KF911_02430 [Pseudomonadales bacterium]|nr:hypothetical protein [Pseudomonadales bacterium]